MNIKERQIFQKVTLYTFDLCISLRDSLDLFKYEDNKDEHLIKYYTKL